MKKVLTIAALIGTIGVAKSQTTPWNLSGNNIYSPNSGIIGIGGNASGASLHYGSVGILAKFANSDRTLMELHSPDGANRVIFQSLSNAYYLTSYQNKPLFLQGGGNVALGDYPGNVQSYPTHKLDIQTSTTDDGLNINQYGSGSSALYLTNNTSGGQQFSLRSTGYNSAQGSGHFSIYQYGATSPDRLFINGSTGNVGIGNTAAFKKLHLSVSSGGDGILISQATTGAAGIHMENNTAGGHPWAMYSLGAGDGAGSGNFAIYDEFSNLTPPRLFIAGTGGNVGLSTKNAPRMLSVFGDAIFGTDYNQNGTGVGNFEIMTNGSAPIRRGISINPTGGAVNFYTYGGPTDAAFNFKELFSGNNLMRILANGQVIIGLKTSQAHSTAKLQVSGTIACQEIYVTDPANDWPDYVFDKKYKLLSLDKLDSYIAENHHLPNVPSANEVRENGASLGALCKAQMEKIEELTLYVIELKKESEGLRKELNSVKEEIGHKSNND